MKERRLFAVALILTATVRPCCAQFIRPPVIVPRPPVPVHVPVHGLHSGQGANQGNAFAWDFVIWGLVAVVAVGGAWMLIRYLRCGLTRRAVIRITAIPPGEAPAVIRQAWVGL